MRPTDPDDRAVGHDQGERLGARQDRDPPVVGGRHFGVVRRDDRGVDDHIDVGGDVSGIVPDVDVGALPAQGLEPGGIAHVAARDRDAAVDHQPGQAAHPRPTHADKMNPAQLRQRQFRHRPSSAARVTMSANRAAPSRMP